MFHAQNFLTAKICWITLVSFWNKSVLCCITFVFLLFSYAGSCGVVPYDRLLSPFGRSSAFPLSGRSSVPVHSPQHSTTAPAEVTEAAALCKGDCNITNFNAAATCMHSRWSSEKLFIVLLQQSLLFSSLVHTMLLLLISLQEEKKLFKQSLLQEINANLKPHYQSGRFQSNVSSIPFHCVKLKFT